MTESKVVDREFAKIVVGHQKAGEFPFLFEDVSQKR
jgi:hypothetical protein